LAKKGVETGGTDRRPGGGGEGGKKSPFGTKKNQKKHKKLTIEKRQVFRTHREHGVEEGEVEQSDEEDDEVGFCRGEKSVR